MSVKFRVVIKPPGSDVGLVVLVTTLIRAERAVSDTSNVKFLAADKNEFASNYGTRILIA